MMGYYKIKQAASLWVTAVALLTPLSLLAQGPSLAPAVSGAPAVALSALPAGVNVGVAAALADAPAADAPDLSALPARSDAGASRRSQFQAFVQEATGQSLPIYGANLFGAPQTYAPVTNISPPGNYLLGAGDEIQLQVWGVADFATQLVVDRNGQVMVPRVGVLTVAGLRVEQLEGVLRSHIGKVFTNFELAASVSKLRSIQVYVVGQAQRPGTYTLSSLSTLINALFASGGPNANGSMRAIELKRGSRTITTLDLYDFIAKGDQSKDITLQPGDVIVIPPVGPQVAVTGAFDHAAIYELRGSTNIAQVLAPAGGVPALASTQAALLERVNPDKNPARETQRLALDAAGLSTPLRAGDVLTLLGINPAFANAVTLQGNVAAPLRYSWFQGMRLTDLIPERDALITADYYRRKNLLVQTLGSSRETVAGVQRQVLNNFDAINWDYAVIERLDRQTLVNQLIPFNLGRAVLQKDAAHNLPLQPGDVVTVFSENDLRVPQQRQSRLVRVEGEVAAPGVYQALPNETLPQLIRRIGGLTPQAYVFGTEFTREAVRQQQQKNLDQLIARLESSLQSQGATQLANLRDQDAARANALMESQRQAQQQQLARLKALRSNGRVALEVNPSDNTLAALPSVPLEDGDRIVVPSLPSFVSAFGAVNNENVFVYRPGRTVGDVFRLAGLNQDSEISEAFVLRADGTVVANRDASGWFSNLDALRLMPGDTVVVPQKVDRESRWSMIIRNTKDITQILANLGLGLAALRSL